MPDSIINRSFQHSANASDEWYTPIEIIRSLVDFDLDPCAPIVPLWQTAKVMYNRNDDGLTKEWHGRVWLNPPYSRPLIEQFVRRMAEHGNGNLDLNGITQMIQKGNDFKTSPTILCLKDLSKKEYKMLKGGSHGED